MRIRIRVAATVLLSWMTVAVLGQFHSYSVPRASGPILVDGRLDEADWQAAPLVRRFNAWRSAGDVPVTRAWLVQEKDHLVLAMECHEEFPSAMVCKSKHDGAVWRDDHIELFLDSAGTRQGYVQIIVNAKGVVADGICRDSLRGGSLDLSWESTAEVKTTIGEDRWCLEMRIPLAVLPPFVSGQDWPFHLVRSRYTLNVQHLTSLQGELASFHDIQCFDTLSGIGGEPSGVQTLEQRFGELVEGQVRSWITLKNVAEAVQRVRVVVDVMHGGDVVLSESVSCQIASGGKQRLEVPWECRRGFRGDLLVMRVDVNDRHVQSFTHRIESILPMLGDLDVNVGFLSGHAPAIFSYSLHGFNSEQAQTLNWEIWTSDGGTCVQQGRTAIRGKRQVIRAFREGASAGIYRLRRFLVDDASSSVLSSREDEIWLCGSPWRD